MAEPDPQPPDDQMDTGTPPDPTETRSFAAPGPPLPLRPGSPDETFPSEAAALIRDLNLPLADSTSDAGGASDASPGVGREPVPAGVEVPGYELLAVLGRGGMGVVYEARQLSLNRVVALKTARGGRVGEKELGRFLIEAEAAAAVRHPNVVQVYEYGEHDGRPYMALEYLPGGSLADRLRGAGRVDPRKAAAIVGLVARGVAAAHVLGIVHRDIKPGNVLFDAAGQPKVTDFGLAKLVTSDLTQTQAVMGTPAYMAPEQADGKTKFVSPAADVWALGVILFECLYGERPFQADSVHGLLAMIRSADTATIQTAGGVPRELGLICRKCLEKVPADRYQTAAALADDLDRFVRGEPVSVRPLGRVARSARWARRNPVVAGLLAVVAAVTVGLGVSLAAQYRQAVAQTEFERKAKELAEGLAAENAALADAEAARRKEADRLRALADAEAARANEVSAFMADLFRASDPLDFFGDTFLPPSWEKQRTKTAEVLLRDAAAKFRTGLTGHPLTRAKLLSGVANSLTNLGDCKAAGPLLREALDLRKSNLPPDHPDVVRSELDLGRLYWHLGDFAEALARFRRSSDLQRRSGAPEAEVLTSRFYEALALTFIGPAEADAVFREVIDGRERLFGPNHRETVAARVGYAALLLDEQRSADLLKLMPKILDALQAQPDGQFRKIVDAFSAFQVGVGLAQQAASAPTGFLADLAYKQAEARLREGLAKAEANMPADHVLVNLIRYELAAVASERGKDDEADRLYERVIADLRKTVGLAHPKALVLARNVGDRWAEQGRVADARALWEEVERANRDRFGPENHWLGVLLLGRVRFECRFGSADAGTKYAVRAVDLVRKEKLLPTREASQALLDAAKRLARPGATQAARAAARELFALARRFVSRAYGAPSREMSVALQVEGDRLFRMGDRAAGGARLAEAEAAAHLLTGEDDSERRDLYHALGHLNEAAGRFAEADRHFRGALALSRRNNWPRDRTSDGWGLVRALAGERKYAEAAPVLGDVRRWSAEAKTSEAELAWIDLSLAVVRLAAGDADGARADARALLKRAEQSANVDTLARSAWAAGLSPDAAAGDAANAAARLADRLKAYPKFSWGYWALALARLRAGNAAAAEQALKTGGPTWNGRDRALHPILGGLCAAKRGDRTAAEAHRRRAEELIAAERPSEKNPFAYADANWLDRVLADVLLAELHAALAPREPAPAPRPK